MNNPVFNQAQTAFERLAPRERFLISIAGGLLLLALMWWIALAPALQTYRESDSAHAKLDAQLAQMQALAQEAKQLRAAPRVSPKDAENWLTQSVKKLGKSTLSLPAGGLQSGFVQITLSGAEAAALALWLTEARTAAGLIPTEAHWKRALPAEKDKSAALWDGSVTLKLAAESAP